MHKRKPNAKPDQKSKKVKFNNAKDALLKEKEAIIKAYYDKNTKRWRDKYIYALIPRVNYSAHVDKLLHLLHVERIIYIII